MTQFHYSTQPSYSILYKHHQRRIVNFMQQPLQMYESFKLLPSRWSLCHLDRLWKKSYFKFPVLFERWLTSIADEAISPVSAQEENAGGSSLRSSTGGPLSADPLWNVKTCPPAECGFTLTQDVQSWHRFEEDGNFNPQSVVEDMVFFFTKNFQGTTLVCY